LPSNLGEQEGLEIKYDPLRQSNQVHFFLLLFVKDIEGSTRVSYDVKRKFGRSSGEMPKGE
jgi:hypothetical protein